MTNNEWERYPTIQLHAQARRWLTMQSQLQLSANSVQAYARALERYLNFCSSIQVSPNDVTREHIAAWIHDMTRPESGQTPPANATLQQRLTAVRLFYDHLIESGSRDDNPVGRGRYTPGKAFAGQRERGLLPHFETLPWIPNEQQWQHLLTFVQRETIRNRLMFALGYDSALRREELCSVRTDDIDPTQQLLRVRAENTKTRRERIVPYSAVTADLYRLYLPHRRHLSRQRGLLFLSESRRNTGHPISIWSWSKIVLRLARQSGLPEFSTHTLRHLCLTHLAVAGWELHTLAQFAGHRNLHSTLRYIHLSGRDLAERYQKTADSLSFASLSVLLENKDS